MRSLGSFDHVHINYKNYLVELFDYYPFWGKDKLLLDSAQEIRQMKSLFNIYLARILDNKPCIEFYMCYISHVKKAIRPISFAYSILHM